MSYYYLILAITIAAAIGFVAGFYIDFLYGFSPDLEYDEDLLPQHYCHECECHTPIIEKEGSFYCSNCGLYH
ncbi:hypothetical protein ACRASX_11170 [Flavobacterium sp. TMP13]|uniref:hypothetical protein n=1 Tax=Flavobacterium sp. TMP13 TaxID=3425950 RepID=UPI003D777C34